MFVIVVSTIGVYAEQNRNNSQSERNQSQNNLNDRNTNDNESSEDFCGTSTYGECNSDDECKVGGCSGQVCSSVSEGNISSTCEWRECYRYGNMKCKCEENKCQWKFDKQSQEIKNITFVLWQKRNESECLEGCKCVGAVVSCPTENGKIMNITAGRSGNFITIIVDKTEANTSLELEQVIEDNKTKLKAHLSNGNVIEIKFMPETASEKAIEKLGELNFTIELKEVGKADDAQVIYELIGNKQGKFLGIFKIIAKVQAEVDAETGNVKVIKPWWSFLASGV